jgi:hypothetical protein
MTCVRTTVFFLVSIVIAAAAAGAQTPTPPQPPPAPAPVEQSDPDIPVDALQPDFTLVGLPTTLRVPKGKAAFRVTHRFTRSLAQGDFGDVLSDFFGFDNGAQIGLEFRYGLMSGTQIGIHRTSDRSIQLFGQHNLLHERNGRPVGLDVIATWEGAENLTEHHRGAFGLLVSKALGRAGAVYAEPIFVANANPFETGDEHTFMLGVGARFRLTRATYAVAEFTPRLAGYGPGEHQVSFGFEGRSGGHLFQFNVSNGFGTTLGQLARGGFDYDNWYIGFNISRKFF